MSDLAPFVAATIKDGVVEDLMRENERLREENRQSKCLRVTSYKQQRVFAKGNVEDGHFHENNINLWVISMESRGEEEIPWKEFQTFEIYCGGAMLVSNLNVVGNGNGYLNFDDPPGDDEARSTLMSYSFDAHEGMIYLKIRIKNWNPEVLSRLRQAERDDNIMGSRGLSRYLRSTLEDEQPNLTFECLEVIASTDRFLGILQRVSLDEHSAKSRAQVEQRRKMRYEIHRIAEDQVGLLDELDSGLAQDLEFIIWELEEEDNTDTESQSFVDSVIQKLPF